MAQIEEDDLKNYNLKRFDCEDPFFMEIFALKVDDAGYMVFPGHTLVCKERVCLGGLSKTHCCQKFYGGGSSCYNTK